MCGLESTYSYFSVVRLQTVCMYCVLSLLITEGPKFEAQGHEVGKTTENLIDDGLKRCELLLKRSLIIIQTRAHSMLYITLFVLSYPQLTLGGN